MYQQLLVDIVMFPAQLVTFLMAPRMVVTFLRETAFQYGPAGFDTFKLYQKCKRNYFWRVVFLHNFIALILHWEIVFIYATWIRIKNLRSYLRG